MPTEFRIGRLNGKFVVSWWQDGKRKRFRLEARSRAEAESEAIDVIRRETAPKPDTITVADLWGKYREEKDGRRVAVAMGYEWKAMGPHFGHLRPDQVTTETCREYIAARRKAGKHDGTIWTELGHLRSVFRWAEDHGLIERAPRVERPQKPAPKERYLTRAEIDRLLAVKEPPHIHLAILLMLSTAARVTAILELTWSRVDFERNQIDLRTDTAGPRKGRAVVPMNAGLRAALSKAREDARSEYVIEWAGEPIRSIKTGFNRVVGEAGLERVSPHVLRHTSAVHMAAAGRPMHKIAQYLGHTSTAVTERTYARFAPEHLREEAEVLDFTTVRKAAG